jgi:hypothetical protein
LGQEQPAELPADLDLVPGDASGFVSIRVAELWNRKDVQGLKELLAHHKILDGDKEATGIETLLGLRLGSLERATFFVLDAERPENSWVVLLATAERYSRATLEERLDAQGYRIQDCGGKTYFAPPEPRKGSVYPAGDRVLAYAPRAEDLCAWLGHEAPQGGGPLRPALTEAARGRHHVVTGFAPSATVRAAVAADVRRTFTVPARRWRLALPDLEPLQGLEAAVLTADLHTPAGQDLPGGFRVEIRLPSADEAVANRLKELLLVLAKLGAADELNGLPPGVAQELTHAVRNADVVGADGEARLVVKSEWDPDWPAAALAGMKESVDRLQGRNKLKQLALAFHNYYRTNGHFPQAATFDKDGKPLLSWRVQLLPFLEQAKLFTEFHQDEPWDSEHNKTLLERMPTAYAPPGKPAGWRPNTTYYQVFVGNQTLFPPGKPLELKDVTDGTADTLLVVEAGEAVPWSKPDDLPYDKDRPLPLLGGIFHDGFQAAFADGRSLRFLPRDMSADTIRAMITANAGDRVDPP